MRAYVFCHHYLKPLLQGVQGAHATNEWSLLAPTAKKVYDTWARSHKTLILLNGGFTGSLEELARALRVLTDAWKKNPPVAGVPALPYSAFHEDQETLGGLLTATGVVVPAEVYALPAPEREAAQAYLADKGLTVVEACFDATSRRKLGVLTLLALLLASRPLAS